MSASNMDEILAAVGPERFAEIVAEAAHKFGLPREWQDHWLKVSLDAQTAEPSSRV